MLWMRQAGMDSTPGTFPGFETLCHRWVVASGVATGVAAEMARAERQTSQALHAQIARC
jgi:hypothetical protein